MEEVGFYLEKGFSSLALSYIYNQVWRCLTWDFFFLLARTVKIFFLWHPLDFWTFQEWCFHVSNWYDQLLPCTLIYGTNPSFLLFFQRSLTLTKVPAGGPTVDGVDNVCWWQKLAGLSVFARRNVGPPLCPCVAQTAGSTRTTVKFTAPPVWRGDGSMWCTARTASSKVPLDCCTASLTLQRAASHWRKDLVQRVIWWYQQQHVSYVRKKNGLLHDWV